MDMNDEIVNKIYTKHKLEENQEVEKYIAEEFNEYLQEDPILNEETLDEGKILNAIRWKLAKFSLRFLKEESLNNFLAAYYADKNGKITSESSEWMKKSRKEKIKKLRELADSLKEDQRQKIVDSQAAKQLEKSGLVSMATGAISFGVAGLSGIAASKAKYGKDNIKQPEAPSLQPSSNLDPTGKTISQNTTSQTVLHSGNTLQPENSSSSTKTSFLSNLEIWSLFGTLASLTFSAMWGAIIIGVAGTAIGLHKFHQANVLRREDIMKELISSKKNGDSLKSNQQPLKENRLPTNDNVDPCFGVPEQKKYPLFDEKHVRSAIKLFGHVEPKYEQELARAIIAKMKKYKISYDVVGSDNKLSKYLPE